MHFDKQKKSNDQTNSRIGVSRFDAGMPGANRLGVYLEDNRAKSGSLSEKKGQIAGGTLVQRKANNTGLPDQLKSGIENLSGHSMDDVRVHYNSDKPAQLNAHAYAQGTNIHLAPGQEKHLPHEAWHIVQQKQGRVRPTLQMKGKVNINDDKGLEKEADVMGAQAVQAKSHLSEKLQLARTNLSPAYLPVQRLMRKMGVDKEQYKSLLRNTVYLYAEFNGNPVGKNGIFKSGTGGHAEDYLISAIEEEGLTNGNLTVWLSTSPCSDGFGTRDDDEGCHEKLEKLKSRDINVKVKADHLYQKQDIGAAERESGYPTGFSSFSAAATSPYPITVSHLPKSFADQRSLIDTDDVAQLKVNNADLPDHLHQKQDALEPAIQMKGKEGIKNETEPGVVQRAIGVNYAPYAPAFSAADAAKMNAVKAYLTTSLAGIDTSIKHIFIYVTAMPGTNPGETTKASHNLIEVNMADWFVRISSVGDICGMLTHEIGVHTLADDLMSKAERSEEEQHEGGSFNVRVGLHTHTISPWRGRVNGRQRDHVNVGRDKGNAGNPLRSVKGKRKKNVRGVKQKRDKLDVNSINARALQYAGTMLRIGDAIDADGAITPREKDRRLHDLLNSFLFDYARIIVTDDIAWRVADKTPLVAQVYNWYKNVIIARYGGTHQWLNRKSMQPTASTWGLRAYLGTKVAQVIAAKIGGNTGRVADLAARGVSKAATIGGNLVDAAAPHTPGVISTIGSATGAVLRTADYLYGEAENLVLPNLVSAGSWLWKKLSGS